MEEEGRRRRGGGGERQRRHNYVVCVFFFQVKLFAWLAANECVLRLLPVFHVPSPLPCALPPYLHLKSLLPTPS